MALGFWRFARGGLGWLSTAPLLFLGRISYSLYLLHQFIGVSIIRLAKTTGVSDVVALAVAMACCVAIAFVVTTLVEGPGKRVLMDFGKRVFFPRWSRKARLGYATAGSQA
jgi:peptidoglycan/LPS O-acetylase OafA/YrhL